MGLRESLGKTNPGFVEDPKEFNQNASTLEINDSTSSTTDLAPPPRDTWGNGVEFLMSCIAMSVGLGNIWRFPYTAFENGGGAFLIPYIIVLFVIGKPIYFMEMILGQFSSKGTVKVYDIVPALRGNGVGQIIAVMCVMTFYSSLMALIIFYLIASFSPNLPWSTCDPVWTDCFNSSESEPANSSLEMSSSSELYFIRTVLREKSSIDDGIGYPSWRLALCLLGAWIAIFLVLLKGVRSSGKASYFLALFPYVIMLVLLIKAATLKGAGEGILFFIKPDFDRILDPTVWYAAVTQCFFSLSVCFGNVIMYASFNGFRRNIYRDAMIVTTLDTFTSLLAGFTIFGILGNLAEITGKDVKDVVRGGAGLAFISYPEAISKFENAPQVFAVLFFFMLFVLGVGSNVAMASSIVTVIRDKFPKVRHWQAVLGIAIFGFCIALSYVTPGGQYILNLVDHHGGGFIVYILGIAQCVAVAYIYGIRKFCDDVEFMLDYKVGIYWRICWAIVTPGILLVILLYSLISMEPLTYNGVVYPVAAIACGWTLSATGIFQLPLFASFAFWKRRDLGVPKMFKAAFKARDSWGPVDPEIKKEWKAFTEQKRLERAERNPSMPRRIFNKILGY